MVLSRYYGSVSLGHIETSNTVYNSLDTSTHAQTLSPSRFLRYVYDKFILLGNGILIK